ncbi:hypothetical protein Q3G72_000954 [Acer saccharum]|nr:hypothetical protein Q3G72_000954 [Acer saccharum]
MIDLGTQLHGSVVHFGLEFDSPVKCIGEKISPNAVTLSPVSVLPASLDALKLCKELHGNIVKNVMLELQLQTCIQSGKDWIKWQMTMEGIKHGRVSISNALYACASLPALSYGKEIHCYMIKGGCISDIFAKSGPIDFVCVRIEVSWNSIIAAYGKPELP